MGSQTTKWIAWVVVALALVGFFDATYLAAENYFGGTPPCFIATGCEEVTTSEYSKLFGVPVAIFGSIYYFLIFILGIFFAEGRKRKHLSSIWILSGLGFLASVYFVYLQLFVIDAICTYCMISAITSTLIFGSTSFLKRSVSLDEPGTEL
jgi:uncharacterized membrane protein